MPALEFLQFFRKACRLCNAIRMNSVKRTLQRPFLLPSRSIYPCAEYIYFAVDYDVLDGYITSTVKPYFEGINEILRPTVTFTILAYMARGTSALGYAASMVWPPVALSAICPQASAATWVSRFPIVGRLNQFHEYSFSYNNGLMSFPLDKDAVSGMYLGFSELATWRLALFL